MLPVFLTSLRSNHENIPREKFAKIHPWEAASVSEWFWQSFHIWLRKFDNIQQFVFKRSVWQFFSFRKWVFFVHTILVLLLVLFRHTPYLQPSQALRTSDMKSGAPRRGTDPLRGGCEVRARWVAGVSGHLFCYRALRGRSPWGCSSGRRLLGEN